MVSSRVDWRANAPLPQTRVIRGDSGNATGSKSFPYKGAGPRRMTPQEAEEYRKKCSMRAREYARENRRREAEKQAALGRAAELAHRMRVRLESEEPIEVAPGLVEEIAVDDGHFEEPSEIYSNDFHAIDEDEVPNLPTNYADVSLNLIRPAEDEGARQLNELMMRDVKCESDIVEMEMPREPPVAEAKPNFESVSDDEVEEEEIPEIIEVSLSEVRQRESPSVPSTVSAKKESKNRYAAGLYSILVRECRQKNIIPPAVCGCHPMPMMTTEGKNSVVVDSEMSKFLHKMGDVDSHAANCEFYREPRHLLQRLQMMLDEHRAHWKTVHIQPWSRRN